MFDVQNIRKDFPILRRNVHGKPLVYLDNAATTQKPRQVIDAIRTYYEQTNANIHRGIHTLAEEATQSYENARKKVAAFIGAEDPAEIIFVRNATEGINLVAHCSHSLIRANPAPEQARYGAGRRIVSEKERGAILLTEMEHHSNLVPWFQLKQELGIRNKELDIRYVPVTPEGRLDISNLDALLEGVQFVSITHASNVLGTINDVQTIVKAAHAKGVPVLVDAAQSVPHMPVNVQELGCDFLVFSGHKMLGPTGIGVLWGRRELLETMPPFLGGGDMIRSVRYDGFEQNDIPWKFEAGTPNIAGAIGLGAAVEYLERVGMENIRKHEMELTRYALERFNAMTDITIYGDPITVYDSDRITEYPRTGVISFNLGNVHAHDLASILDRDGIAIRSGHHCAEPLVRKFGQTAMARVSFYFYNTKEEVDQFIESLKKARKIFM